MSLSQPIPGVAEPLDEDDDRCSCGCWCGGCGCADARQEAEEGDWEYLGPPAHCCECGQVGVECEYRCNCV